MQPDQIADRSMAFPELLRTAAQTYLACFGLATAIVAALYIPLAVVQAVLVVGLCPVFTATDNILITWRDLEAAAWPKVLLGATLIAGLGGIYALLVQPIVTGAVIHTAICQAQAQPTTFTAAYQAAFQRMPNLIGASLIAVLIASLITASIFLITTGLFMSLMSLGDSTSGRRQETGTLLLGGCLIGGSLLLLGIAVLLGILLVGLPYAIMLDGLGVGAAIRRSIGLVRGSFGIVVLFQFTLVVVLWVVVAIPNTLTHWFVRGILPTATTEMLTPFLLTNAGSYVIQIFTLPIQLVTTTVLYRNLRARHAAREVQR